MGYLAVIPYKRSGKKGKQRDGYNSYDLEQILKSLQREGYHKVDIWRSEGMGSELETKTLESL